MKRYGIGMALIVVVPALINSLIWIVLVVPQQSKLREWRAAQALTTLTPRLTALLTDTHAMLVEWQRMSFTKDDPSAAMQRIQRLAGQHHVQVKEIQTKESRGMGESDGKGEAKSKSQHATPATEPILSGYSTMPLELEVVGGFHKLAHWLSEVEAQAGFQVDSWTLAPGKDPGQPSRLTVQLTALLRGA